MAADATRPVAAATAATPHPPRPPRRSSDAESRVPRARPEYGQRMFDVGLVGILGVWVTGVAWRALWGAAPARPIRFAVVAAVSVAIHLGFHAAATAAPALDAVALVLAGWSTCGLFCLWRGRVPSAGFRPSDDDGGGSGGDGGGGGGGSGPDDGGASDGPSAPGGDDVDWDTFERDFAAYVDRAQRTHTERGLEPAAD